MRTIHRLQAATLRSSSVLLTALCVCIPLACVPQARAVTPPDLSASSPIPYFESFGPAQESYASSAAQSVSLAVSTQLTPETLGDLMMIHQRYLAAIEAYERGPHDSAVIWNKLGIAYQHMYALDLAKYQYEKALQLNPNYAEAINNLGTVYYGEKNYHKAERYYRKALQMMPDCATFYSNLGTAYFADHRYKQGIEAYRKAFSIDPDIFIRDTLARVQEIGPPEEQAALNYAVARLYAQAGMTEAAIDSLRQAFMDGFDDQKKLMEDPAFAKLRMTPKFHLLMAEEHIPEAEGDQARLVRARQPLR